ARARAPTRRRNSCTPCRGPPKYSIKSFGSVTSASSTSSWSDVFPNSILMSCPGSRPTVSAASEMRISNRPAFLSLIPSTRPTMCERTRSSAIAATGISTLARPQSRARAPRSSAHRSGLDKWPAGEGARNASYRTSRRPHSPSLADRRAAEHLDDARARCGGGVVGQRIEGGEPVRDDLMVRNRRRRLTGRPHEQERDIIAPRIAIGEEQALQRRRAHHFDIARPLTPPRQRFTDRPAGLAPAPRQVPAAHVAVLD